MKNQHPLVLTLALVGLLIASCTPRQGAPVAELQLSPGAEEELWNDASELFAPLPAALPNPDNPTSQAKVDLGRSLYYDTRLSRDGNISCNSCHNLATFGVDNLPTSPGDAGEHGARNSPTVLNAGLHIAQFWDGRATDLEAQAGMPVLNPVEMAIPSEEFLVDRLGKVEGYPARFAAAFPGEETALTYRNIRLALGAFERTLLTPSRFDAYLAGDRQALTTEEKSGLRTFIDYRCTTCHNGIGVGAASFQKFGLADGYWVHTGSDHVDDGRYAVTGDEKDRYFFKVASLRNVEKTGPYFHDGSVEDLEGALRVMLQVQIGIEPPEEEVRNIAAFLRSLTGEVPPEALPEETTASSESAEEAGSRA